MTTSESTVQEQQLVILAMAEGALKQFSSANDMDDEGLVHLWSELLPDTADEMARHVMTASLMISLLLSVEAADRNEPILDTVAHYRRVVLGCEAGMSCPTLYESLNEDDGTDNE